MQDPPRVDPRNLPDEQRQQFFDEKARYGIVGFLCMHSGLFGMHSGFFGMHSGFFGMALSVGDLISN